MISINAIRLVCIVVLYSDGYSVVQVKSLNGLLLLLVKSLVRALFVFASLYYLFSVANYIRDLEKGWSSELSNVEVVDLISKFTEKSATPESDQPSTEEGNESSRVELVHRMFYRLHRVNDTSRLSFFPSKEELLTNLGNSTAN